ncbi:MAG: 50S ribosomal protein L25 [Patescibacteria group bacterium]|nr:50S ribosomal protein L25 [Patescibacteria group bacterium]
MTVLKAEKRESGKAKEARKGGLLPAVVYGRKEPSQAIAISLLEFEKALHEAGETSVIELQGLGASKDVLIHEVTYDVLTGQPLHADFYAIEKGQKVSVAVPLEFEGVSPAVKDLGGILVKVMHELEVEGEPKHLPRVLRVNIESLATLESQIHVKDLPLPSGVVPKEDAEEVVAMISVAKEEPVEEVPMDVSQIEMSVERGKKEEEGVEGAAPAAPEAKKETPKA